MFTLLLSISEIIETKKYMRIIQINAVYEQGSTGRMIKEMHNYFLSKGYDSYICVPNYKGRDRKIINIGCKFDYLFHSLMSKIAGLQGYFSIVSTLLLLRKISSIKPDIVHLHNLHNNYINLPLLFHYLGKNNVATVVTMHDFWFMTGHCCYYTNDNCMKWQKNCGKCPAIRIYNSSWFFDNTSWLKKKKEAYFARLKKLAVIGNSKWTTKEAAKSFFKKALILDNIYNWINTDIFYPRDKIKCREKYNLKFSEFIVIGVSQYWSILKGLDVIETLAKRNPSYHFMLVGKMNDQRILPNNVTVVGLVESAEVLSEYYSLSDVFINPSLQETFGLVTAEAISCGLPVIVNNATATPELVLEGCGYVVENNNIKQIEQKLLIMRSEKRNREQMHKLADSTFGKRNMDKYISTYIRLLAND